jgi:hypothetical protein
VIGLWATGGREKENGRQTEYGAKEKRKGLKTFEYSSGTFVAGWLADLVGWGWAELVVPACYLLHT